MLCIAFHSFISAADRTQKQHSEMERSADARSIIAISYGEFFHRIEWGLLRWPKHEGVEWLLDTRLNLSGILPLFY